MGYFYVGHFLSGGGTAKSLLLSSVVLVHAAAMSISGHCEWRGRGDIFYTLALGHLLYIGFMIQFLLENPKIPP